MAVSDAVGAWRERLGPARVLGADEALRRFGPNITELATRQVPAALFVESRDEVAAVLAIANEHGVPIYPLSTGKNWGVGSKLPVRDGAALLDMSGMRACTIDEAHACAVVEPGVTQRMLWGALERSGSGLVLNVTGSGDAVSVLGNALERGVGMLGQRHRDVRALEVVTATGRVVRTGFWHAWDDALGSCPHHFPEGIGPDLTGLFIQSNLGVVTRMVVGLSPKRPVRVALMRTPERHVPALVDALVSLRRRGILEDRIELDGEDDPRLFGLDESGQATRASGEPVWWAWAPIFGEEELAGPASRVLERAVDGLATLKLFAPTGGDDSALPEPVRVRLARLRGEPGNHSLESIARASGVPVTSDLDLDHEPRIPGFVCALPAVPTDGASVLRVLEVVRRTGGACGVQAFASFNTVSAHAFEGYVRVAFDRRDAGAVARAQRWAELAHDELIGAGMMPLRVDVERMRRLPALPGDDYWAVVELLRGALDPRGIIAPGRYCP
jgi:4-cresol dehydrogenase (hydroxylating)